MALGVAGLGAVAWLTCAGWPTFVLGEPALGFATHAAVLGTLALGVAAVLGAKALAARWLLLCGYPGALALAVARIPEAQLDVAHDPWSLSLAVLSLSSFAAGSVIATRPETSLLQVELSPLGRGHEPTVRARSLLRPLVLGVFLVGAFAIAVIAPRIPSFREVDAAWRETSGAAAVLSAVVASALAVSVLALHMGSMLRSADAPPPPSAPERRLRVVTLLSVALLGGVVYFTIR